MHSEHAADLARAAPGPDPAPGPAPDPGPASDPADLPIGICVLSGALGAGGQVRVTSTVTHTCFINFDTAEGVQRVGVTRPASGQELLSAAMPMDMRPAAASLSQLRVVMQGPDIQVMPDWVGDFPQLRSLRLCGGEGVAHLPSSLTRLQGLRLLQLEFFVGMRALPAWFDRWPALAELEVNDCGLEELPASLAQLTTLRSLTLKHLWRLTRVPLLPSLHSLVLHRCGLEALPTGLAAMTQLQQLVVSACARLAALPPSAGALCALQTLCITGCPLLRELPAECQALAPQLLVLKLSCVGPAPAWLGECLRLRELYLSLGAPVLPQAAMQLRELRVLRLNACGGIAALPARLQHSLPKLEHLELSDFPRLTALPPLGSLSALGTLILTNCAQLAELPPCLGGLGALHTCLLRRLPALCELPASFAQLRALRHLALSDCALHTPAVAALARALQFFPLQTLSLLRLYNGRRGAHTLLLGRALRRRPPPSFPPVRYQLLLHGAWLELGLPETARLWGDEMIVRHWRALFEKRRARWRLVLAFACGTHARLGAHSRVMMLDDGVLEMIAHSVIPYDPDAGGDE